MRANDPPSKVSTLIILHSQSVLYTVFSLLCVSSPLFTLLYYFFKTWRGVHNFSQGQISSLKCHSFLNIGLSPPDPIKISIPFTWPASSNRVSIVGLLYEFISKCPEAAFHSHFMWVSWQLVCWKIREQVDFIQSSKRRDRCLRPLDPGVLRERLVTWKRLDCGGLLRDDSGTFVFGFTG